MFGLLLLLTTPVMTPAQDKCPHLMVSGDSRPGGKIGFSGAIHGGDAKVKPAYNWVVSSGSITSGQGTATIEVTAEPEDSVTATLEVGGYAASCSVIDSATETAMPVSTADCPLVMIVSASEKPGTGIFGAQVFPENPAAKWKWTISAGKVVKGPVDGRIDITAASGSTVTGSVTLLGGPAHCKLSESQDLVIQ